MQRAILTTIALYRHDSSLFDNLVVPEGMNKSDFVDRLLMEQGEAEVILTNPATMKAGIGFWSRTRLPMWQKLFDMQTYEYNPIWNVDGETWHEGESESHGTASGSNTESRTYTRDRDQVDTLSNTHTDTRTPNLTETTAPAGDEITTNLISADNSENWSNDTKSIKSFDQRLDTKQNTGTETTNGSYTDQDTLAEDISDAENKTGSSTGKDDRTGAESWHEKRQGNIGVTMTQQLLKAERELWEENDVQLFMINEFKREFTIMVY